MLFKSEIFNQLIPCFKTGIFEGIPICINTWEGENQNFILD